MMVSKPEPFELSGGALCLDFANTLGDRPHGKQEKLRELTDLLRWSAQAGTVKADERRRLEREAAANPASAHKALRRAIAFREVLYRVFGALAAEERPAHTDLEELNTTLGPALRNLRVEARGGQLAWAWSAPGPGFEHLLWPVARSAAELLTSAEAGRIRECASEVCSWLFVDRSRTHRRRWCDMKTCGNRAKARRHYERRKRTESV